jgi:hypothetical protein
MPVHHYVDKPSCDSKKEIIIPVQSAGEGLPFHTLRYTLASIVADSTDNSFKLEEQIQECRSSLAAYSNSNPKVLAMFDATVSQWKEEEHSIDLPLLLKAVAFAAKKHENQFREGGDCPPYIIHPIGVARSLWQEAGVRDTVTLLAALLHDTLEDTDASPEEIETQFGSKVLSIVKELTDDPILSGAEKKQKQIEHAPFFSSEAKLVKLADRLYNVRDLKNLTVSEGNKRYLGWALKLLEVLKGTSPNMERALLEEIQTQLKKYDKP